jgi:penicillin-binding protein 1A
VGYPNDRTEMNGLFYGANVDGGTFPAAIWGAYMKSIIGGFCGAFPLPKEPFQSTPFFGEYSTTGGSKLGYGTGTDSTTTPTTPTTPAPAAPTPPPETQQPTSPSGGAQYDPEQYESPPQGPPDTGGDTP